MGDTAARRSGCACSFGVVGGSSRADARGVERGGAAVSGRDGSAGCRRASGRGRGALWRLAQDRALVVEPLPRWRPGRVGGPVPSRARPSVAGAGGGGGGDL